MAQSRIPREFWPDFGPLLSRGDDKSETGLRRLEVRCASPSLMGSSIMIRWRSIFLINLPPAIGVDAAQIDLDRYLPLGAVGHFGSLGQRPYTSGQHLHVRDTAYRIFAAACG